MVIDMAKWGVVLHTPERGTVHQNKTFASRAEAARYAKSLARSHDVTANAAVFRLGTGEPYWKLEWMF